MIKQHCDDHVKVCETLARIEAKLDTVIESNTKQWGKIEGLQTRADYRNGADQGSRRAAAVIASVISFVIAGLGLVLNWIWRR
ncbi:MAG: hypothetical protein GXP25_16185 [Planctomycetes bacterium]|nr:hypothetical protein [Planctomycetota bacterium]